MIFKPCVGLILPSCLTRIQVCDPAKNRDLYITTVGLRIQTTLWTGQVIADLIDQAFQVKYATAHAAKLLNLMCHWKYSVEGADSLLFRPFKSCDRYFLQTSISLVSIDKRYVFSSSEALRLLIKSLI